MTMTDPDDLSERQAKSAETETAHPPSSDRKSAPRRWYQVRWWLVVLVLAAASFAGYRVWVLWPTKVVLSSSEPEALKILFIGNSITYFNDMPSMFARLVQADDSERSLKIVQVTYGGASLQGHYQGWSGARRVLRHQGPWDYVVLQEHSARAIGEVSGMREFAHRFDAEIRNAGGRTILFGRGSGQGDLAGSRTMHRRQLQVAQELSAPFAPCALVWERILKRYPKAELFADDGGHPSPVGSYIDACVLFATILKKSPQGLPCQLKRKDFLGRTTPWVKLPEDLGKDVQQIAWEMTQAVNKISLPQ